VPLNEPGCVVALPEGEQSLTELFEGVESPHPQQVLTLSGMMVPSCVRGPRGVPTRVGASRLFSRMSRSTRRLNVRRPLMRSLAQTFRCPSP
jgi:hypothetical protein